MRHPSLYLLFYCCFFFDNGWFFFLFLSFCFGLFLERAEHGVLHLFSDSFPFLSQTGINIQRHPLPKNFQGTDSTRKHKTLSVGIPSRDFVLRCWNNDLPQWWENWAFNWHQQVIEKHSPNKVKYQTLWLLQKKKRFTWTPEMESSRLVHPKKEKLPNLTFSELRPLLAMRQFCSITGHPIPFFSAHFRGLAKRQFFLLALSAGRTARLVPCERTWGLMLTMVCVTCVASSSNDTPGVIEGLPTPNTNQAPEMSSLLITPQHTKVKI